MKSKIILLSLFLTGCASTEKIVEVKIPVRTPCTVETPIKPDYNVPKVNKGADIFTQIRALLADRQLSLIYEEELETVVEACKK